MLDSLRLGGALTRFDLDNALQPITQTLPGGDQVRRSFISLGGDMQISNTAGYNYALERRVSFDSLGRVWRHLQDPHPYQPAGDLYGYDRLGRLVAVDVSPNLGQVSIGGSGVRSRNKRRLV